MVTKAGVVEGRGAGGWGQRSGYRRTTQGICGDEDALHPCQYPTCDSALWFCNTSPPSKRKKGIKDPLSYVLTTVRDTSDLKIKGLIRQNSSQQSG